MGFAIAGSEKEFCSRDKQDLSYYYPRFSIQVCNTHMMVHRRTLGGESAPEEGP